MFVNSKRKKILRNEKTLKKIHGSTVLCCSNSECTGKVTVTKEESERVFQCSKCSKGFLRKEILSK